VLTLANKVKLTDLVLSTILSSHNIINNNPCHTSSVTISIDNNNRYVNFARFIQSKCITVIVETDTDGSAKIIVVKATIVHIRTTTTLVQKTSQST